MSFDKALEHVILNIEKEANAFDISLKSELGGILDEILYDDLIDAHYDKYPSRLVYFIRFKNVTHGTYTLLGTPWLASR